MERQEKAICPACEKTIKVGVKFCTNCGTDLSELVLEIITTEVPTKAAPTRVTSTELDSIDQEWVNLKQLIEQKNKNAIADILVNYISRISHYDEISRKKIYDLIGKAIKEDLQFFKQKLYIKFYKATEKFLVPNLRTELEKYIMQNYWFFKGEKLIISSKGSVIFNKNYDEIRGRFYISNQRMIVLGKNLAGQIKTWAGYGIMEFPYMGGYLFQDVIYPYKIKTNQFSVSRVSIKLEQIKKKGDSRIDYFLKFEYESKGKVKEITDKLRVVPLEEEGESEDNFKNRREMVFSKITEFFNTTLK